MYVPGVTCCPKYIHVSYVMRDMYGGVDVICYMIGMSSPGDVI